MGEYFYTNMCSHLFEVAKRILLLIKIIRLGDYYSHWNFQILFSHIFMCVGIFIFHSNIFIFFVELFYSYTNNSSSVSAKNQFCQSAVFARPALKLQMYTTHIALIHYINSKAFAQNPYMENVSASFSKDIFVQKFACF